MNAFRRTTKQIKRRYRGKWWLLNNPWDMLCEKLILVRIAKASKRKRRRIRRMVK